MGSDEHQKSISNETTFSGTSSKADFHELIAKLSIDLNKDMARKSLVGKLVTLKMKTVDFELKTRSIGLGEPTREVSVIEKLCKRLLQNEMDKSPPDQPLALRLLGVGMSTLSECSGETKQVTISQLFQKCSTKKDEAVLEGNTEATDDSVNRVERDMQTATNCDGVLSPEKQNAKYVCPICNETVATKFLTVFNRHIDSCLKQSDQHFGESISSSLEVSELNMNSSYANSDLCCSSRPESNRELQQNESVNKNSSFSFFAQKAAMRKTEFNTKDVILKKVNDCEKPATSTVTKKDANVESCSNELSCMLCPVCSSAKFTCQIELNRHLDECLTLNSDWNAEQQLKRKRTESPVKKKKQKSAINSIAKYFS